jgi:hypothetical protein
MFGRFTRLSKIKNPATLHACTRVPLAGVLDVVVGDWGVIKCNDSLKYLSAVRVAARSPWRSLALARQRFLIIAAKNHKITGN